MKLKIVHLASHKNKLALNGREKPKALFKISALRSMSTKQDPNNMAIKTPALEQK